MRANRLQPNTSKSDVFWSSTSCRQHQLPTTTVRVGVDHGYPSKFVRNPGNYFDSDPGHAEGSWLLYCSAHLPLGRAYQTLFSNRWSLVVPLVLAPLDYGNTTLAGLPAKQHRRLQSVLFLGETRMRFALLGWASFRSFVRSTRNKLLEYLENGLT